MRRMFSDGDIVSNRSAPITNLGRFKKLQNFDARMAVHLTPPQNTTARALKAIVRSWVPSASRHMCLEFWPYASSQSDIKEQVISLYQSVQDCLRFIGEHGQALEEGLGESSSTCFVVTSHGLFAVYSTVGFI